MRPIYLEMSAFGPYAGRQIVDFRQLGERNLFLIYGPTGAGKTTVLDAMCYALYGETSGNERTGAHMRSEYALPGEETYVFFSFSVGEKQYRVERKPEQETAKKRGSGLRKSPASARLYELKDGTAEEVIATKNVREEVERILGFKAEQFRQVVLLPQGDFRKLLLANSGERQQIMQTLFHTRRYALLQELAKEKHDAVRQQYLELGDRIGQWLQQLGAGSAEELGSMRRELESELTVQRKEWERAEAERSAYQQIVQDAQVLHSHWQSLKEARAEEERLAKQKNVFDEKRKHVDALRRAQLLVEPCRQLKQLLSQGTEAGKAARHAADQAEKKRRSLQEVQNKMELLTQQAEAMQGKKASLVLLEAMIDKADRYGSICQKAEQMAENCAAARKNAEKAREKREQLRRDIDSRRKLLEKQQEMAAAAEQIQNRLTLAEERWKQEQAAESLAGRIADAEAACRQLADTWKHRVEKSRQDRTDYESVQAVFLKGQAALLAEGLIDGAPCPVCGATDHPNAAPPLENMPTKGDVDRRKRQAEKSDAGRQEAEVAMKRAEAERQAYRRQYEHMREQYPFEQTSRQWQENVIALENQAAAVRKVADQAEQTRRAVAQLERQHEMAAAAEEKAREHAEQCRLEEAKCRTEKTQAEADVPPQYRQAEKLRYDIETLRRDIRGYETQMEQCRKNLVEAEKECADWTSQERAKQEQVQELRKEYGRLSADVTARARREGFSSLDECRAVQAELPVLEDEVQAVSEYDNRVQQIQGRISQEEKRVGSAPEPQMDEYNRSLQEKTRRSQSLLEQCTATDLRLKNLQKGEEEIRSWQKEQSLLTEQYKSVGAVYELLSGQNTGINFERYVLGALLDEVLSAANARLDQMSRHRYELQRSRSWDDKRVRRIGLDIDVFDNYTGDARPANTLSGGETFLASLSLALGLADVVQAYSGGIHLDTIFIDEGFGTLDGETLDYALKTLIELKHGGRLVGIISHVAELKERIDARLAVRKTERGSMAAFELA